MTTIKTLLSFFIRASLGEKRYYQLARFLWHDSRRDPVNRMTSNGEMSLLAKILEESKSFRNPVFFDIGCNVGDYTKGLLDTATREGISGLRLFCFEPNPVCVEKIREKVDRSPMAECVEIVSMIVTDHSGESEFYITGETAGTSSIRIDSKTQGDARQIRVKCVDLDEFCRAKGIGEVIFVKVDTEGNDLRVIEGAKGLLQSGGLRFLQFEYNHRWILFRSYLKDVFDTVTPLGYKVAKITSEGLVVYERWHYELETFVEGNYLIGKDFSSIGLPLLADHSGTYFGRKSAGRTF